MGQGGGASNTLYYPTRDGFKVNACRGYFQLKNGLTAGDPNDQAPVRSFVLHYGSEASGITTTKVMDSSDDKWYTLDGMRLTDKPSSKGIYIRNGRKVVIKQENTTIESQ